MVASEWRDIILCQNELGDTWMLISESSHTLIHIVYCGECGEDLYIHSVTKEFIPKQLSNTIHLHLRELKGHV